MSSLRLTLIFTALLCSRECLPAQALAIRTQELPWGIKGIPYHAEITASVSGRCPDGDVGLALVAGQLPKGVELFNFGLEGTPRQIGHFRLTLRAANACSVATRTLDLIISGKPILMVSPSRITLHCRAGSGDCAEDMIRVEGSWPDLPYSIEISSTPWLKIDPSEGKTPDPESALSGDRVHVRVDARQLAPGTYSATLKFFTRGGENAPIVPIQLEVLKAE